MISKSIINAIYATQNIRCIEIEESNILESYKFHCFSYINTFAFERLVFEENNEPFLLENASNLTHECLYDNFNKKI